MTKYETADQLLRPGEVGLFIYTEGGDLTINEDDSGSTGNWHVDPLRRVDYVIIYKRNPEDRSSNDLLLARCGDLEGPIDERYHINLRDIKLIGYTDINWAEFALTQSNPIRYIDRL